MKDVTAIIKSFLREEYLFECVRSLWEFYPTIKIAVADDSYHEGEEMSEAKAAWLEDFKARGGLYVPMPFDSGLCRGRNTLVELATTPYVLIGDDDFQYRPPARLEDMRAFLEDRPEYDLIGGRIIEKGELRNYQGFFDLQPGHFKITPLDLERAPYQAGPNGMRWCPADLTFNFFIARTETCRSVPWDDKIKVSYEHSAFFIDLKRAGKLVAFTPDSTVVHKPAIPNARPEVYDQYAIYRTRKSDKLRFFERFDLESITDIYGNVDTLGVPRARKA